MVKPRAVRSAKKTNAYARAKAEWGARLSRPSSDVHALSHTHARQPTRHRSDGLRRPPPGTRGRCAQRSCYFSSSRARLSDCSGGGGKPVSRRPCRVATVRSTYHTAVVPAILVDEGGARIAGPATPERSWPARARTGSLHTHTEVRTPRREHRSRTCGERTKRVLEPTRTESVTAQPPYRTFGRARRFCYIFLVSASKPS